MRNSAILASLIIYLCATTCLGELLKAPVLFSHFIEHQADNKAITFYTFIYQHYQDDDGNDKDNDRDSQLPFKSADSSNGQGNPTGVPVQLTNLRFFPFSETSTLGVMNYQEPDISSPYLSRFWQPPKLS